MQPIEITVTGYRESFTPLHQRHSLHQDPGPLCSESQANDSTPVQACCQKTAPISIRPANLTTSADSWCPIKVVLIIYMKPT